MTSSFDQFIDDLPSAPSLKKETPNPSLPELLPEELFLNDIKNPLMSQTRLTQTLQQHPQWAHFTDSEGFTPLLLALLHQKHALADFLLSQSVNPSVSTTKMGWTPLHFAISNHAPLSLIDKLLKMGAPVNQPTTLSLYPLTSACSNSRLDVVQLLLQSGAHPSPSDTTHPPLMSVAFSGSLPLFNLLKEHHLLTQERPDNLHRAFIKAAQLGHDDLVQALLPHVSIDFSFSDGQTALHHAVIHHRSSVIRLLLQAGAHPSLENQQGFTAQDLCQDAQLLPLFEQHQRPRVLAPVVTTSRGRPKKKEKTEIETLSTESPELAVSSKKTPAKSTKPKNSKTSKLSKASKSATSDTSTDDTSSDASKPRRSKKPGL